MNNSNLIQIKFTGDGIAPELIKASELAEILIAIEKMLIPLIQSSDTSQSDKVDSDIVAIGLTSVVKGSLCLEFSSAIPDEISRAFRELTTSISEGKFYNLPSSSIKGLQSFSKFTQKRNCSGQFSLMNGTIETLTCITPEMDFSFPKMLTGETVLYGKLIAVGGRKPKVRLDVCNRIIYCDANQEIVESLGKRINSFVGVKGNAMWQAETLDLKHFTITEITPYQDDNLLEGIAELRKTAGSFFKEILDVEQFISSIRED